MTRTVYVLLGVSWLLLSGLLLGCNRAPVPSPAVNDTSADIWGTAWRLEYLAEDRAIGGVRATLEFPKIGRASGDGSCNQFAGAVEIAGETIKFGPLVSTKMACADAIGAQEANYLKGLEEATTYRIEGTLLTMYSKEKDPLLRFMRTRP